MNVRRGAFLAALAACWAGACHAETTIDPAQPYAYGANVGWVNAYGDGGNGAVIGPAFCTGYFWSANCGWIGLGNGGIGRTSCVFRRVRDTVESDNGASVKSVAG